MAAKRPPNRVETTPSGIEIHFWDEVGVDGKAQKRRYTVNAEKADSISSVAGAMDKYALTPAAAKLEREGLQLLVAQGVDITALEPAELLALMKASGVHYDTVWEKARIRGDVAHEMLLGLIRDQRAPKLSAYPEDLWPWLSAGLDFAVTFGLIEGDAEILGFEQMVASARLGLGGRFDLLIRRGGHRIRLDFKTVTEWKHKQRACSLRCVGRDPDCPECGGTNKVDGELEAPYFENLIQGEGYELCAVESGFEASDYRAVVRLGPDGTYDYTEIHRVCEEDFLDVLAAYRTAKRVKAGEARPAPEPEAVAA
jgi:hypothetical protein